MFIRYIYIIVLVIATSTTTSQTLRFFEFAVECNHGNWQDNSFIAATSNQTLIDTVLANINRPVSERKHINGKIASGSGDVNRNGSHWFLWHFIPNQWTLSEFSIEVCDGCPFSDVDKDTSYWLSTVTQFCPWSSKPVREVSNPMSVIDSSQDAEIVMYPNPARTHIKILGASPTAKVFVSNSLGMDCAVGTSYSTYHVLDVSQLPIGVYFLKISTNESTITRKVLIE